MRKVVVAMILFMITVSFASATSLDENTPIRFFYSRGCQECTEMKRYLTDVLDMNPELKIEMYCIDDTQDQWIESCTQAGIPVWGVPRIFIGDICFADFIMKDGGLLYERSYYGYVGYCNQIINAIEDYTELVLSLPGSTDKMTAAASSGSNCDFGCD